MPARPAPLPAALAAALAACAPAPAPPAAAAPAAAAAAAGQPFAPDVLGLPGYQWRITFTPDGRTAYFGHSEGFFPATRQAAIHVTRLVDGRWTAPEVAPFSGRHPDLDPFVTPDGARLYFSSIRPVDGEARGDLDVWYVERAGDGWGAPARLGPAVNGATDELCPSLDAAGDLYVAAGPPAPTAERDWDLHVARRAADGGFAARAPIAAANTDRPFDPADPTADWEFNPEITPDGRTLVFTSLRPGGAGLGDLYVMHRRADGWSPPQPLGPAVNTAADEYHPTLAGGWLHFVRNARGPTAGDFVRLRAADLPALRHPDGDR